MQMPKLLTRHNERRKQIIIANAIYINMSRYRCPYFKRGPPTNSVSENFGSKPEKWGRYLQASYDS
jgi:hypothetical protein